MTIKAAHYGESYSLNVQATRRHKMFQRMSWIAENYHMKLKQYDISNVLSNNSSVSARYSESSYLIILDLMLDLSHPTKNICADTSVIL